MNNRNTSVPLTAELGEQRYPLLARHGRWMHRKIPILTEGQRYWLRGNQSLTKQLIEYSDNQFSVRVLREYRHKPYVHEVRKLGQPLNQACLIREVELLCKQQPIVFARSIIPLTALRGTGLQLARLGNKPLGHLLFKQANVDLEQREIALISLESAYWARRTIYQFNGSDILVSEFFLDKPWDQ